MKARTEHRSYQAFLKAFLALTKEKKISSITVKDLVRESGYSRTAFYSQFETRDDFFEQIIKDEIECSARIMSEYYSSIKSVALTEVPLSVYTTYFEHIYARKELYTFIIKNTDYLDTNRYFVSNHRNINYDTDRFNVRFSDTAEKMDPSFWWYICARLTILCVEFWVNQGFEWSPHKMAEQLTLFVMQAPTEVSVNANYNKGTSDN